MCACARGSSLCTWLYAWRVCGAAGVIATGLAAEALALRPGSYGLVFSTENCTASRCAAAAHCLVAVGSAVEASMFAVPASSAPEVVRAARSHSPAASNRKDADPEFSALCLKDGRMLGLGCA